MTAEMGIVHHAFCHQCVCVCQPGVCVVVVFAQRIAVVHVFFLEGKRLYQGGQQQFTDGVFDLHVEGDGERSEQCGFVVHTLVEAVKCRLVKFSCKGDVVGGFAKLFYLTFAGFYLRLFALCL
jgi:hypothetical protein